MEVDTPESILLETLRLIEPENRRRFALVFSAVAAMDMGNDEIMRRLVEDPIRESSLEAQIRRDVLREMADEGWVRPTATLGDHIASWATGVSKRLERLRL